MDTRSAAIPLRLERVREVLRRYGCAALLVPSSDPHLSEYLPTRWQGREWLSGFTGSMGTLVVGLQDAVLFADSRYWEQAEAELVGTGIELVKTATVASNHHIEWLTGHLKAGDTVAVDGQVLSLTAAKTLRSSLEAAHLLLRSDVDLLDEAWASERPALPAAPIYEHLPPQATQGRAAKLAHVRQTMADEMATHHFISTLDDIAWLTNLRGADVDYNPVFLAHALIDAERLTLFVGVGKIDDALRERLQADGVALAPYAQTAAALAALPAGSVLLLDPKRITAGLRQSVPDSIKIVEAINPCIFAKSRKSELEAAQVRQVMIEDGAAMCEFYAWFEAALARGERITELTVDEQLSAARARRQGFVCLSFPTIAGFNANGAMPHYRATPESHAVIAGDGLLLIDSGGQYLGGTTDITRVWAVGQVSREQQSDFTHVLRGTMALSRARYPRGLLSPYLDSLARAPLWQAGIDYGHGTGHGVGYFLNVHEGPQSISRTTPEPRMAMEPGMITSIEPGVYRAGQWGVRIENLVLSVPVAREAAHTVDELLAFETLTLCPIDTRCVAAELLRADEIDWLNRYHAVVRERLRAHVDGAALAWLLARTEPIAA